MAKKNGKFLKNLPWRLNLDPENYQQAYQRIRYNLIKIQRDEDRNFTERAESWLRKNGYLSVMLLSISDSYFRYFVALMAEAGF